MQVTLPEGLAVAVALVAAICDVRNRRIPNLLTFGAAAIGLIVATLSHGLSGAGMSAGGWLLALCLWLPLYALGGMGAGDVKLMAAIGAFLGPSTVFFEIGRAHV